LELDCRVKLKVGLLGKKSEKFRLFQIAQLKNQLKQSEASTKIGFFGRKQRKHIIQTFSFNGNTPINNRINLVLSTCSRAHLSAAKMLFFSKSTVRSFVYTKHENSKGGALFIK